MSDDQIKVVVRVRPLNQKEQHSPNIVETQDCSLRIRERNDTKVFNYDFVADDQVSQANMFDRVALPIAENVLQGYNGTLFVYGQTGAGKTHTLMGPKVHLANEYKYLADESFDSSHDLRGLLPRTIDYLFERINYSEEFQSSSFEVHCSFLEIYMEQLTDLLGDGKDKTIYIREDSNRVKVENLCKVAVSSKTEALEMLVRGLNQRKTSPTLMNKESSRSHAIFSIYLTNKSEDAFGNSVLKKSCYHLIDLAGSERQKSTQAMGENIKEAAKINKSLMVLGLVINGLVEISEGKKRFLHYRDSKLTMFLKDSLGGNSKTAIVANISPALENVSETVSTLMFAQNAKKVKNKARINEITAEQVSLKKENRVLKEKLNELMERNIDLEGQIKGGKKEFPRESTLNANSVYDKELGCTLDELKQKEEKILKLEVEIDSIKTSSAQFEYQLKSNKKELSDNLSMMSKLKHILEDKDKKLTIISASEATLYGKIEALKKELDVKEEELKEKINSLEISLQQEEIKISEKEKKIGALREDCTRLKDEVEAKNEQIEALKQELNQAESNITALNREKDAQGNKLSFQDAEILRLNDTISELNMQLKEKTDKYDDIRTKSKQTFMTYEGKLSQAERLNESFKAQFKELESKVGTIKKARDLLMNSKLSCERELKE